eukprot:COSAG01_NODE_9855_length_2319_cov_5.499550_2_plen_81_part_00
MPVRWERTAGGLVLRILRGSTLWRRSSTRGLVGSIVGGGSAAAATDETVLEVTVEVTVLLPSVVVLVVVVVVVLDMAAVS